MYMHVLYGAAEPPYKGRLRSFHDDDDDDDDDDDKGFRSRSDTSPTRLNF